MDASGSYLYFSAAPNGRFNIYRVALDSKGFPIPDHVRTITMYLGVAFMPVEHNDRLYYSEYIANGYTLRSRPIRTVSISKHELGFDWLGHDQSSQKSQCSAHSTFVGSKNQSNLSSIAALKLL